GVDRFLQPQCNPDATREGRDQNMARMRFTAATVESIKPTSRRVDYFDATLRGFGLRVTPTGAKTWFYWYRLSTGKARRWTIGRYGKDDKGGLGLATAREKARIAAGKL